MAMPELAEIEIVRHGNTKPASSSLLLQQGEAMKLVLDIKKRRWFVEQQDRRVLRQAGGQQNTLPFAPAQGPEYPMPLRPASGPLHGLLDEPVIFSGFEPAIGMRISSHRHQLLRRERQVGAERLRQVAHLL